MRRKVLVFMELILIVLLISLLPLYIYSVYSAVDNVNTGASISYGSAIIIRTIGFIIILLILLLVKKILASYQLLYDIPVITTLIKTVIVNNKIIFFISIFLVFIATLLSTVYIFQRSIIYFPNYYPAVEHILIRNNEYEHITITDNNTSVEYSGWSRFSEDRSKTIIYFGGNTESSAITFISHEEAEWDIFRDYNFIMIDYPGYGKSEGSPSENANYAMADATYNYVIDELNIVESDVIIIGYSLGTGIASYIAANKKVDKLILLAPYSSMTDVFNTNVPIFYGPLKHLIKDKYDSAAKGYLISVPVLIIASKSDKVIKYRLSVELHDKIINSKLVTIDKINHNQFFTSTDVLIAIKDFLQE